jgi:hypothetical protein
LGDGEYPIWAIDTLQKSNKIPRNRHEVRASRVNQEGAIDGQKSTHDACAARRQTQQAHYEINNRNAAITNAP